VNRIAAHIDIAPTLLDASGIAAGMEPKLDGRSLLPLLKGVPPAAWPDRTLYFQWHRGDAPEAGRAFAARAQRYKLLRKEGEGTQPALELYDIEHDPFEQKDLFSVRPEIASSMYRGYLDWFRDVGGTRGYAPIRIAIGDPRENPTVLTRQDLRTLASGGSRPPFGHWELDVARPGKYDVSLHFPLQSAPSLAHLQLQAVTLHERVDAGSDRHIYRGIPLTPGSARLEAWVDTSTGSTGVQDVEVSWARVH
jgi:hypothetical protein